MFKATKIDAADLSTVWDSVRPGLERVRARSRNAAWRPEDVYTALKERVAELHLGYLDAAYAGFFILSVVPEAFTGKKSLLVWVVWNKRGMSAAVTPARDEIYRIAKEKGLNRVFFSSARRGWSRRLPDPGWRVYEVYYERML